jgi:hypothetical protein
MYEAFIDLDELIVRCRDKSSRKFIQEAVSCYKAGAFRSCIVSTWNAVVFDFLHKLRELELFGDGEASILLREFDELRIGDRKYKELWKFESDIPEIALSRFELLSNVEKSDIDRLFQDRSRCAHPSMTSLDEPFEATAELARYHLRSAVTHLLQRPPVQGRAAFNRIIQDISSDYFPTEPELALKYFQKSPLARARFTLIKDVIIVLTKSLLTEDRPKDERARQFSAINAISSMYFSEAREILNSQLSDIIINRVTDENWDKSIIYLGSVNAWDELSDQCKLKAEAFIEKIDIFELHQKYIKRLSDRAISILVKASHIDFLRESVNKKLQISIKDLLLLKEACKDNFFKEMMVVPTLRELSSQANMDELLSMITEDLLKSDETIKGKIIDEIKEKSLMEIVTIASRCEDEWVINLVEIELEQKILIAKLKDLVAAKLVYKLTKKYRETTITIFDNSICREIEEGLGNISFSHIFWLIGRYEDDYFMSLIEPVLEEKFSTASLEELFKAKINYTYLDEPKAEIIELFDKYITKEVECSNFDDLLMLKQHWDDIPVELFENISRNNIPAIIDNFAKSGSFISASDNANLLIKISEYLSPIQWDDILGAFFENDQIYGSYACVGIFESLFKKSIKIHQSVQSHWLPFRDKLNGLNGKDIGSLKRLIENNIKIMSKQANQ